MRARARVALSAALALTLALAAGAQAPAGLRVALTVTPAEATVGERLTVTVTVDLPPDTRLEPPEIGPTLGDFTVLDGGLWRGPEATASGTRWVWSGSAAAFRTGELELPAISVRAEGPGGLAAQAASEAQTVRIESVLGDSGADAPELADLKPPASIAPDYGPLFWASVLLLSLLAVSALLWWLHRRYAARLTRVPLPDDPFHRTPPHVWVYGELQQLLDRRLAEQGQVDLFFSELSRIVKTYLGGRYRVDLLERTTAEVPLALAQAGAAERAVQEITALLARCDRVKFARETPDPDACRSAVEHAYHVVDVTRPAAVEDGVRRQGAA